MLEPNPTLRIPILEIEKHPWVTDNGHYPFFPYSSPATDPVLRNTVLEDISRRLNMEREKLDEELGVNDGLGRCSQYTATFHLLMDQKRSQLGM